jgi:hypothetical protein
LRCGLIFPEFGQRRHVMAGEEDGEPVAAQRV